MLKAEIRSSSDPSSRLSITKQSQFESPRRRWIAGGKTVLDGHIVGFIDVGLSAAAAKPVCLHPYKITGDRQGNPQHEIGKLQATILGFRHCVPFHDGCSQPRICYRDEAVRIAPALTITGWRERQSR